MSSLPPLGVVLRAANRDNNDCRWQSYLCFVPRSGKGGVVGNFGLVPFNEQHPLSLALLDSSPTGEPRFPCCPLWGKCRGSGKGGVVGIFELVPFIGRHPLSQPLRAASSPIGEPSLTSPERGGGAQRRRGQARYAEYPLECTKANSQRLPCCPPWGKCRAAAKGVPLVFLSCYHSSNNTPSVSPYGLPAPPLGSRGCAGPLMLMNNSKTGA